MKKCISLIVAVATVLGIGFAALPAPAYADDICAGVSGTDLALCGNCVAGGGTAFANGKCTGGSADSSSHDLNSTIHTVINTMLFIIGILAVIMIIFGGIRYVTSAGNEKNVEGAKNTIMYSVIGLAVAVIAFAIVQWVFTTLK